MKVVFLCASEYGFECLRCVCDILNCNVVGVITMPKQYEITYDNGRKSRIADNPILDELFEFCELGKKELFISKKVNKCNYLVRIWYNFTNNSKIIILRKKNFWVIFVFCS